ncbi:MAG: restriction endonuclease [Pirellulales bacterium]|nr:restriction endonuclease [Pirellulales bacterium]
MDKKPDVFRVGDLYSSAQIQTALSVGNAGGVRLSLGTDRTPTRMVLLTSVAEARQANENPYHDRVEGAALVYTGAGREGDQLLSGINKRIPQQLEMGFPIYGFTIVGSRRDKSLGPKRWMFLGLLEYVRHYPDTQLDVRQKLRQVWIFEFYIHANRPNVVVSEEVRLFNSLRSESGKADAVGIEDRQTMTSELTADKTTPKKDATRVEAERSRLLTLSPERFEHVVRHVLLHTGFERVCVTKYSQDGGIDVNAFVGKHLWLIRNVLVQVQAKRWLHTVGRKEVAELRGSLQPFAHGAVVTTSHFSRAAIVEASEAGKKPIVLVDGYEFATILLAMGKKRLEVG